MPLATEQAAPKSPKAHQVTTLIHNAGVIRPALLPDVKLEDLNALVNLHLSAAVLLVQAALPAMKAASFGRVVLVSSRAVLGLPTRTVLLGDQGRHARHGAHLGARARAARHHGQRGRARADPDRNFHSIVPEGSPQVDEDRRRRSR